MGATVKDIVNVVTDADYGVVDISHGIDKAIFFIMNQLPTESKQDGSAATLDV